MVLDNPERNEAESMIKLIKEKLETASDKIKVSVAAGVAFGSGKEILEIAEAADAHMYENKKSEKESGC